MCVVWISEQTAIISLYSINYLFTAEPESVYCAVRVKLKFDFVFKDGFKGHKNVLLWQCKEKFAIAQQSVLICLWDKVFFSPMPPHVLRNFSGFPPGCGDSVADFWVWDAHEARLRCPDDVSGDMQEDEIPGGALSLNLLTTQTMVTTGMFPCKEKFPW